MYRRSQQQPTNERPKTGNRSSIENASPLSVRKSDQNSTNTDSIEHTNSRRLCENQTSPNDRKSLINRTPVERIRPDSNRTPMCNWKHFDSKGAFQKREQIEKTTPVENTSSFENRTCKKRTAIEKRTSFVSEAPIEHSTPIKNKHSIEDGNPTESRSHFVSRFPTDSESNDYFQDEFLQKNYLYVLENNAEDGLGTGILQETNVSTATRSIESKRPLLGEEVDSEKVSCITSSITQRRTQLKERRRPERAQRNKIFSSSFEEINSLFKHSDGMTESHNLPANVTQENPGNYNTEKPCGSSLCFTYSDDMIYYFYACLFGFFIWFSICYAAYHILKIFGSTVAFAFILWCIILPNLLCYFKYKSLKYVKEEIN